MSGGGASDVTHLQGGPENNFQDVVLTGHAETESSYDQIITPVRLQFPATRNVPVQLENIPCARVVITNLLGNDPIYVGGLAEQTPYYDLHYIGDFRGTILYEGMSKPFPVRNANRLQVVGTPLQSFTYEAYPNVLQKVLTNNESPPNPDTFPPEVLLSDPADESTGILIDRSDFTITMDEPILPSSINSNNVTITPLVLYDIFPDPLNNTRVKIALLEQLQFSTEYTIAVIVGGLKDFSENAVAEEALIQFTTEAAPPPPPPPDITAPTVQATNPIDNATSVPKDKIVSITMDEAILASSVNTTNVTVSPSIDYDVFINPVNTSQIIINHTVNFAFSTLYTVTLISGGVKDLAGNGIAAPFVFDFTIEAQPTVPDTTAPTVVAIDPVNGATGVVRNKTITITMSEDILESSVTSANIVLAPLIAYSVFRDPTDATKIILDPSSDLPASTLHTITLTANGIKDLSDNGLASQLQFGFTTEADAPPADTTPPTITARSPISGATNVAMDTDITVDFSEPLTWPIPANSFELFAPGPTEVTAVTITNENGNAKLRMNPDSNLTASTPYTVFVRTTIEDVAGNNLASQDSWSFTTAAVPPPADTTPPTVIAQTPSSGAANVARNTTIIVDFSESMDTATIHSNSVELFRVSDSVEVTCSIGFSSIGGQSNRRVTLTPTSLLVHGAQYQAFVRTTAKDVAGNAIASEVSWLFTITEALTIVARSPTASASNVAVNSDVFVDFSKALNTGTVTTSTFQLFNTSTGVQVTSGSLTFENGNQRIRFNPSSNLSASTQYQVIVKSTVADTTGVTLGSDNSWFFTTVIQFNISNRVPAPNDIDVAIGSNMIIDFNKAINTTTATVSSNNVELYDTSTNPDSEKVVGITFSQGNQRITMTPTSAMVYSRVYMITLKSGLKDTTGASLPTTPLNYTFTTESDPVTIELVYSVAGSSGEWWEFGNISSPTDRQGRGLKITSNTTGVTNALHNVRITEVTVKVRRSMTFTDINDDTMYCIVRNSTGQIQTTIGTFSDARTDITTNSSGQNITFANPNNTYVMKNGDCLLIEYDDGDDDEHFELNNATSGSSHSQEVYREADGSLHTTSKDMAATIFGERT